MNENVFRTHLQEYSTYSGIFVQADWTGLDLDEMTDVELVDLAIEKWQMVRKTFDALPDGTEVRDVGVRTCALCQVYYDDGDCTRCPILAYTGCPQCRETPYLEWAGKPCPANADAEIAFLEELKAYLEQQKGENDE